MELSPKTLSGLAVQAVILGAVLGVLYGLFRVIRVMMGEKSGYALPSFWNPRRLPFYGKVKDASRRSALNGRRAFLNILTFFFDIMFCIAAVAGIFLLAYVGNNGRIRWFIPLGATVGFLLFELTLGRVFRYLSEFLAEVLRVLLDYTVFLLLFPLRFCARKIRRVFVALYRKIRNRTMHYRAKRLTLKESCRILGAADEGFGCFSPLRED